MIYQHAINNANIDPIINIEDSDNLTVFNSRCIYWPHLNYSHWYQLSIKAHTIWNTLNDDDNNTVTASLTAIEDSTTTKTDKHTKHRNATIDRSLVTVNVPKIRHICMNFRAFLLGSQPIMVSFMNLMSTTPILVLHILRNIYYYSMNNFISYSLIMMIMLLSPF